MYVCTGSDNNHFANTRRSDPEAKARKEQRRNVRQCLMVKFARDQRGLSGGAPLVRLAVSTPVPRLLSRSVLLHRVRGKASAFSFLLLVRSRRNGPNAVVHLVCQRCHCTFSAVRLNCGILRIATLRNAWEETKFGGIQMNVNVEKW